MYSVNPPINDGDDKEIYEKHQKLKELSVMKIAAMYAKLGDAHAIISLLKSCKSGYFSTIAKAKTAKIVRSLIDSICSIPNNAELKEKIIKESIEWCKNEKRAFLRQRLELKLTVSLLNQGKYPKALKIIEALSREVRKLDDKQLLVELHLIESQLFQALKNIPKAKVSRIKYNEIFAHFFSNVSSFSFIKNKIQNYYCLS